MCPSPSSNKLPASKLHMPNLSRVSQGHDTVSDEVWHRTIENACVLYLLSDLLHPFCAVNRWSYSTQNGCGCVSSSVEFSHRRAVLFRGKFSVL